MSGYFQRLAKRSGVGGGPVSDVTTRSSRAAIAEVEEVHQVSQPAAMNQPEQKADAPFSSSLSTEHSQPVDREYSEPQPRFENERSDHSIEKTEEKARVHLPDFENRTTEDRVEEVAQPDFQFNEPESKPSTEKQAAPPEPEVVTEYQSVETSHSEQKPSERPAETSPSFIRAERPGNPAERVVVRSVVESDASVNLQREAPVDEPEFLQTQVRIEPARVVQNEPALAPETTHNESGPRIHIGQIQVEVHAPPSQPALQAAPKPTPRPSRSAKPQTRNPDLRRYYVRGF